MQSYEEMQVSQQTKDFEPIDKAIKAIEQYIGKAVNQEYYQSKNDRLESWVSSKSFDGLDDIYELVTAIFTVALLNEETTIQSMIGQVAGKISLDDPLDRAKTAAECIALAAHADLIDITTGSIYMVSTSHNLDSKIERSDKHVVLTRKPQPKTDNQILGNRYKQHDGETCLSHINTMNSIKFSLNLPLLRLMEEQAQFTIDTTQKAKQWDLFISESYKKYLQLARGDNEFYLEHAYDTRGRVYCEGYFISYQGSSFKKAIVQLAHKEIVKL